jgi:hypothetical protein
MAECEMLAECAFFKKYSETHSAACHGVIVRYCRGGQQSECKRKEYLLRCEKPPPVNMMPGGSILKLDAQVFGRGDILKEEK